MDEQNEQPCEGCGEVHGSDANVVPFDTVATARLVIEKAMNMTLDPNNPLNQLLVAGAGMILQSIESGMLVEEEIDMASLVKGSVEGD